MDILVIVDRKEQKKRIIQLTPLVKIITCLAYLVFKATSVKGDSTGSALVSGALITCTWISQGNPLFLFTTMSPDLGLWRRRTQEGLCGRVREDGGT